MPVKTNGADFKAFYTDPAFWPNDAGATYHEDEVITINGIEHTEGVEPENVPDDAMVIITGGYLNGPKWENEGPSLEAYFRQWKKKQDTAVVIVECPVSALDDVKDAIKGAGGKIRG